MKRGIPDINNYPQQEYNRSFQEDPLEVPGSQKGKGQKLTVTFSNGFTTTYNLQQQQKKMNADIENTPKESDEQKSSPTSLSKHSPKMRG